MNLKPFLTKLKNNPRPVMVDVWAPWCGPCRMMEPALKQVSRKYQGQVDVWKINADESPEIVKSLRVMGIPTLLGFADAQEIVRKTGMQSADSIELMFDATLHQRKSVILPPAPIDRWVRSGVGLALILLGWSLNYSWILMAIGGVVLFSAFYDRCPIFRAVAPRLLGYFRKSLQPVKKE